LDPIKLSFKIICFFAFLPGLESRKDSTVVHTILSFKSLKYVANIFFQETFSSPSSVAAIRPDQPHLSSQEQQPSAGPARQAGR
jgi:hypothetical protein